MDSPNSIKSALKNVSQQTSSTAASAQSDTTYESKQVQLNLEDLGPLEQSHSPVAARHKSTTKTKLRQSVSRFEEYGPVGTISIVSGITCFSFWAAIIYLSLS